MKLHKLVTERLVLGMGFRLISHLPRLRGRAARIIFDLTLPHEGKEVACGPECIPALVKLLSDGDAFVRSQAAAALMRCEFSVVLVNYNYN